MSGLEVFARQRDVLGEGPLWSQREQALYWLDIGARKLQRRRLDDVATWVWPLPATPGCLAELESGALAVAMGAGVQRFDPRSGAAAMLAPVMLAADVRFNDGKVDPRGRFWVGTMQNNFGVDGCPVEITRRVGALFCLEPGLSPRIAERDIGISNTLAWSPDATRFYFADSLGGAIHSYAYDPDSGIIGAKRPFFEASGRGIPDGSAIDVDGCLWNARWDGGAVLRITPDGVVDRVIDLPVTRPTSCAFGGPNLDLLFITSASNELSPAELRRQPLAGSVFVIAGIAQGLSVPAWTFGSTMRRWI